MTDHRKIYKISFRTIHVWSEHIRNYTSMCVLVSVELHLGFRSMYEMAKIIRNLQKYLDGLDWRSSSNIKRLRQFVNF